MFTTGFSPSGFKSSSQKIRSNLLPTGLSSPESVIETNILPFDKLIFEKQIGEGGFANVWQGKYDNECVAIKVSFDADDGSFLNEANIMSKLSPSRYIVTCIGYSVSSNNIPCIVMELMQESLYTRLTQTNLDWNTCVKIAADVASALQLLHQHNYVHSDIKSANILLKDGRAKLGDFGVTQKCDAATTMNGSMYWMAPESASEKENTTKSDIFSFGIFLLELTLGRNEKNPKSFDALYLSIYFVDYITLLSDNFVEIKNIHTNLCDELKSKGCPAFLIDLIRSCLEEKPELRPTASATSNAANIRLDLEG